MSSGRIMPPEDVARRRAARQNPPGMPLVQQREELLAAPARVPAASLRIALTISSNVAFGERRGRREPSSKPAGPWRMYRSIPLYPVFREMPYSAHSSVMDSTSRR
jgi:hypothetical protein